MKTELNEEKDKPVAEDGKTFDVVPKDAYDNIRKRLEKRQAEKKSTAEE